MHPKNILLHLDRLEAESKDANFIDSIRRLRGLVEKSSDGTISLAEIYEALFKDMKASSRRVKFAAFRSKLQMASAEAEREFELVKPDLRNRPDEEIRCEFRGSDLVRNDAEHRFTAEAVSQLDRMELVEPEVYATTGKELAGKQKPLIRFFISYAHADDELFEKLLGPLEKELKLSVDFRFEVWTDHHIAVGTKWFNEIGDALKKCDFGLLMVSRDFLTSRFIIEKELRALTESGTPVIPVALKHVDFSRETKGLAERQFFQLKETGKDPKAFSDCRGGVKERFIRGLVDQIEERVRNYFKSDTKPAPVQPSSKTKPQRADLCKFGTATFRDAQFPDAEVDPEAAAGMQMDEMGKRVSDAKKGEDPFEGMRTKAVDYLTDWFLDPDSSPVAAVLGEIGSGKTTMLMMLARALGEQRKKEPNLPPVIFVDLKNYQREEEGLLENILDDLIRRHWTGDAGRELSSADVIRCVQEEGGLIIFDGLDEKIIPLSEQKRVAFVNELWRVLPPSVVDRPGGKIGRGKMIISCRSHYFPTVISQNEAFAGGGGRTGVRKKDYAACVMLPWRKEQINRYLAQTVGEDKVEAAQEIIASIHNLSDLAPRPYLLSLIAPHLGELELKRASGEKVNGASLYALFVEQWLARDTGKHVFTPEHKLLMMESLAAHLWSLNQRELPWKKVAQWLDGFLHAHPEVAKRYDSTSTSAEMLNQDFRTATFFLRPDKSKDRFRFAHTSLLEYFLACHLQRSMKAKAWDLPLPSDESLEFVGQLCELEEEDVHGLTELLEDSTASVNARRVALRYWLIAEKNDYACPSPGSPQLQNLDMEDWRFNGLALAGASFVRSSLRYARFKNCSLTNANFKKADAALTEFHNCQAANSKWQYADLTGALWRKGSLVGADLEDTKLHDCDWVDLEMEGATLPDDWRLAATMSGHPPKISKLGIAQGHSKGVSACVFSPDGRQVASASWDNTVRVWDAQSGKWLLTLEGHSSEVTGCAFSPDGSRVASASCDNTVRVWDAQSGKCLLTLEGHSSVVTSCAFSPDGSRLASASYDGSSRLWDAQSGNCLLTLEGHLHWVMGCAFSPDGRHLLSVSYDGSSRLWDAQSGKCLLTFERHSSLVNVCAFSPDGSRLASASYDETVRVWEAQSGRCLLTLEGHSHLVTSCAFSTDGSRLASASCDNTVKVWNAQSGKCLVTLEGHSSLVACCAFSPDGSRVALASYDGSVRVWDAQSGKCLLAVEGHSSEVTGCAFSPDGSLLASSADNTVRVWEAQSGKCLLTLEGHSKVVTGFAFSPDGNRVASVSYDMTVRLWDAQSGKCLLTLEGHSNGVKGCAFSPDGSRVASASSDNTVRVWDAQSGKCLLTLEGHSDEVKGCAFSLDGRQVASTSSDNTVRVWDAQSGKCLRTWVGAGGPEHASVDLENNKILGASPEGWRLLGWRYFDEEADRLRVAPAEIYGPLPPL